MKRRKGTGTVCFIGHRWCAYGSERRVGGKRVKLYVGSALTRSAALKILDGWLSSKAREAA